THHTLEQMCGIQGSKVSSILNCMSSFSCRWLYAIHQQFDLLRAYQRLATSCVIAIPRFDWSSFGWPRRSQGLFAQFPA
ncbi:hypothetical protein, partial [Pseudomonas aeruginosa]|uniref:hypothetical protein n=1 Tax=Pseudomonas aeruginosa TaxID=287 RepID=UPI002490A05B